MNRNIRENKRNKNCRTTVHALRRFISPLKHWSLIFHGYLHVLWRIGINN